MAKYLIAEEGLHKGLILIIENKDEYKIGRDPDLVDFVLDDPSVSRKHALIFKEDDGYCITDLSHTNPTIVNGEGITDPHLLKEGDELQIGKTFFHYTENISEKELPQIEKPQDQEQLEPFVSPNGNLETIFEEKNPEETQQILDEEELSFEEKKPFEEKEPLEQEKEILSEKEPFEEQTPFEETLSKQTPFEQTKFEQTRFESEKEKNLPKEEAISPEEENIETLIQKSETKEKSPYDTIFEEEAEEELPFNLISENAFILKVISGSNVGAEFGMDKGQSYIIGKDHKTCNIVFNDLSVSKEHAKITIDADGNCYIEDLGSRNGVIVNSKKVEQKQLISSKDIITLGTTVFIIIDPKEAQETLYALPPTFEEEPLEELVEEEKEEVGIAKTKESDWRKVIIPPKHLVISGSVLLILFIMFITFFSLFKSAKIEIVQKEPTKEIEKALEKFSDVQFSFNPANGKLFLIGHVLTAIDQQELIYNIDTLSFIETTENNVIIDEYVWKNINELLNDNEAWRSVSIHSPIAGSFIASGYVQSTNDLEKLSDYFKANFPYYDKLQNKVVIEDVLKTEIEGLIISKGLSAISYQLASGEVILAGRYSMDDERSFEKLISELKKIDGIRAIKNAAIKTTPDMARINLTQRYKITGVITSAHKKIVSVIVNDKLINVDGFLDGMKITEINPNTIYLEKDGLKYKIDYIR